MFQGLDEPRRALLQAWLALEVLLRGIAVEVKVASVGRIFVGVRNRIPGSIWIALYAILLLSMLGVGFHAGIKGSRSQVPSAALGLSFAIVLVLIADLDRPRTGLMKSDQSGVIELSERLQKAG